MLLLIFLTMHSTWCFQFKCESIRMPRYLIQNSRLSCLLFIASMEFWHSNFFWGAWKITKFDFFTLSESLLEQSHMWILFNSAFDSSIEKVLLLQNNFASSVKRWNSKMSEQQWNSFTYSRNNRGPSTYPCGTSQLTLHLVDVALLTVTTCCRSLR